MQPDIETYASDLPLAKLSHLPTEDIRILAEIKRAILNTIGARPRRIILFGSKARGDWERSSDLDVAVIVDELDSKLKNAIFDAVADVELQYLTFTTTLAVSTETFQQWGKRERRIALDIEREGIPL